MRPGPRAHLWRSRRQLGRTGDDRRRIALPCSRPRRASGTGVHNRARQGSLDRQQRIGGAVLCDGPVPARRQRRPGHRAHRRDAPGTRGARYGWSHPAHRPRVDAVQTSDRRGHTGAREGHRRAQCDEANGRSGAEPPRIAAGGGGPEGTSIGSQVPARPRPVASGLAAAARADPASLSTWHRRRALTRRLGRPDVQRRPAHGEPSRSRWRDRGSSPSVSGLEPGLGRLRVDPAVPRVAPSEVGAIGLRTCVCRACGLVVIERVVQAPHVRGTLAGRAS